MVSALIKAEEAGDKLNEDELLTMVFLLLIAGHETTAGEYTLEVSAQGFKNISKVVVVRPGETLIENITLEVACSELCHRTRW